MITISQLQFMLFTILYTYLFKAYKYVRSSYLMLSIHLHHTTH